MRWTRHALTWSHVTQDPDQILTRTYYVRRPHPVDPRQADRGRLLAAGAIGVQDIVGQLPDGYAWRPTDRSENSVPSVPSVPAVPGARHLTLVRPNSTRPAPDEMRARHYVTAAIQTGGLLA